VVGIAVPGQGGHGDTDGSVVAANDAQVGIGNCAVIDIEEALVGLLRVTGGRLRLAGGDRSYSDFQDDLPLLARREGELFG
jgi:hypothetical protein